MVYVKICFYVVHFINIYKLFYEYRMHCMIVWSYYDFYMLKFVIVVHPIIVPVKASICIEHSVILSCTVNVHVKVWLCDCKVHFVTVHCGLWLWSTVYGRAVHPTIIYIKVYDCAVNSVIVFSAL